MQQYNAVIRLLYCLMRHERLIGNLDHAPKLKLRSIWSFDPDQWR